MYEAFFQLKQRPFAAAPQPDRYFPAQSVETAYHALARSIDRAEGPGLLIGAAGTGKSLLLEMLARRFEARFTVVMLASGNFSGRRELLQAIMYELQMPYRGLEAGELRLALFERLARNPDRPAGMLLLVDEAQRLPLRLLEELRLLGDYAVEGQGRVRLIMAGSRALEEHLANPKLDALSQRLAVRAYVAPLDRGETAAYVRAQIAAMGGQGESMFTPESLDAVHQATDGIPRLVNQLCDHALVLAFAAGRRNVDRNRVEEAWSDLQQLPAPWNDSETDAVDSGAGVIEFGDLADEDEPEAVPFSRQLALDEPSPAVKLETITAQLASLEEEFDMPEPTEPLSHGMHCDPFAESFVEEEVVLDRYASADSLAAYPVVSSVEGSMLGSLLEPHMQSAQPQPIMATPMFDSDLHCVTIATSTALPLAMADHWATSCSIESQAGGEADKGVGQEAGKACQIRMDACESDVILVENDPQTPPSTVNQPIVRRQEYRQLFAKLRNG